MAASQPTAGPGRDALDVLDAALGLTVTSVAAAREVVTRVRPAALPVLRAALEPPLPSTLRPGRWLAALGRRGSTARVTATATAAEMVGKWLDVLVPQAVEEALGRIALTELVLRHVDLDEVVAAVDVDAVVARVDVESVLARVDVDEVVAKADLDQVVRRLDLTDIVLHQVDLGVVVDAVLARVDLATLAQEVIDVVDLPEIIRESTGTMASETVRTTRMQGIAADEAVARVRAKLLPRRA